MNKELMNSLCVMTEQIDCVKRLRSWVFAKFYRVECTWLHVQRRWLGSWWWSKHTRRSWCAYVYMYTQMCALHICICVYMYYYICIYVYIYVYICMILRVMQMTRQLVVKQAHWEIMVCTCIYVYKDMVSTYMYMCVSIYVYMYICIYIYMCIYMTLRITQTSQKLLWSKRTQRSWCAFVHRYVVYLYEFVFVCICTYWYMCVYVYVYIDIYI